MATLRVSVVGTKELKRKLEKMNPGTNRRIMVKSLTDCAVEIQSDAMRNQIRRGQRNAAVHQTKLTSRNEGRGLIGSIGLNKGPLPGAIEVGTYLGYGAIHEFGLGKMPKRAFLEPALDKVWTKFEDIVLKNWKREAGL